MPKTHLILFLLELLLVKPYDFGLILWTDSCKNLDLRYQDWTRFHLQEAVINSNWIVQVNVFLLADLTVSYMEITIPHTHYLHFIIFNLVNIIVLPLLGTLNDNDIFFSA